MSIAEYVHAKCDGKTGHWDASDNIALHSPVWLFSTSLQFNGKKVSKWPLAKKDTWISSQSLTARSRQQRGSANSLTRRVANTLNKQTDRGDYLPTADPDSSPCSSICLTKPTAAPFLVCLLPRLKLHGNEGNLTKIHGRSDKQRCQFDQMGEQLES